MTLSPPPPAVQDIDICICTFRRPHLAETLESVARIALRPGWKLRVIVADNDEHPTARDLVTAAGGALRITYIHAPARNISVARNACLEAATAPLIAFIDDDELVTSGWLTALVRVMESTKADAVLGPVRALYRPGCADWLRKDDYHSTLPTWSAGSVVNGGTGNVLLRRSSLRQLRFRNDLGRSGGEDTAFFHTLTRNGGRLAYAPDAVVTELVPQERESLGWLLKRRFRSGQTHGLLLTERRGGGFPARQGHAFAAAVKAGFCFGMAAANLPRAARRRFWSLRCALHAGVACRLLRRRAAKPPGHKEDSCLHP